MAAVSVLVAVIGFSLAYFKYSKRSWEEQREVRQYGALFPVLLNKWYVDELYDALFVNRAKDAGRNLWKFDAKVVDGVVNGSAWGTVESATGSSWWDRWIVDGLVRFIGGFIKTVSWPVRLIQTGYVQNYALVMLPASLAACVPVFIATATSACASAGASLVPSPHIATSRPFAC